MESPFHMRLLPGVLIKMLPVAIALMALIAVGAYWHISSVFKAELNEKLEREGALAVSEIDTRLSGLAAVLNTIAHNGLVVEALSDPALREASIKPFFQSLTMASVPGALIGFTDLKGRLIAANRQARAPVTFAVPQTVREGRQYVDSNSEHVIIAVPVKHGTEPRGVIFSRVPTSALATYLSLSHYADLAVVMINGTSIGPDVAAQSVPISPPSVTDENWVTISAGSDVFPGLDVLLFFERDALYAPLRGLDRVLGLSALANLIVLTIGLVLTAVLISRPLVRFAEDVNDVRDASDLSRRVSARGYSEIVRLARTFNDMLGRLQKTLVSCDMLEQENRYRQVAEQTLRDKQAENAAIVETVADAIIVIDKHGSVRSANPATFKTFGYQRHELIGHNVSRLMPEPHRSNHDQYLLNYLETGDAKIIGIGRELEAVRNDGTAFPIELYVAGITLNDEPHFVGVIRDITERRRVDRMQREFIALVSHELRTPLTSLTGSLGLVNSGRMGEVPEKVGKLLDLAQNNANRLIDLVNDIMVIEKLQSSNVTLNAEELELVALLRSVLADIASYGDKNGVTFALHSMVEEARVLADPRRLAQVLINLLSNASKFSDSGSVVDVRLERHMRFFRVSVCDRGVGIPADVIDTVFDKFVQLDTTDAKNGQGSGLGLPIAQAIMELHGSRIEVTSEVGVGSTFYFDLIEHLEDKEITQLDVPDGSRLACPFVAEVSSREV